MAISSMPGSANDFQVGNIVYQSLQRPKLLRGGEWQLSLAAMLTASAFGAMALMTRHWPPLLGALLFGWPVQWLIRMVGRHDPQWTQVYFRARRQPLIREPHGSPSSPEAKPLRIIPKPNKFLK
jgi:type IV secretory pathway TrbD component